MRNMQNRRIESASDAGVPATYPKPMPIASQQIDRHFYAAGLPDPINHLVPDRFVHGGVDSVQRPQECFKYAFRYLQEHADEPTISLIHGFATWTKSPGSTLPHAWVEIDGAIAFDPNLQEFFAANAYRAARIHSVFRQYSARTAIDLAGSLGGFGYPGEWESGYTWCRAVAQTVPGIYLLFNRRSAVHEAFGMPVGPSIWTNEHRPPATPLEPRARLTCSHGGLQQEFEIPH